MLLAAAHWPTRLSLRVVRCGLKLSHYADIGIVRQPGHAQGPGHPGLAGPPPPVLPAFHADRLVLDQPGPRWFGYLTAQRIRRGVHKSVQALEADIRARIENWNQIPRPFTWNKNR